MGSNLEKWLIKEYITINIIVVRGERTSQHKNLCAVVDTAVDTAVQDIAVKIVPVYVFQFCIKTALRMGTTNELGI